MLKKFLVGVFFTALLIAAVFVGLFMVYPVRYLDEIGENTGALEPALVCAVIHAESKFRTNAQSGKGATGLMQLTEATAEWMAGEMGMDWYEAARLDEPAINIALGCYYLNWLLEYYDGDRSLALCAYNAGQGNVNRWLNDTRYSADGKTLDTIPFPETRQYLRRVENNFKIYEFLLLIMAL